MRFPSIQSVASALREVNSNSEEGECEVRLQVYEDGAWAIRVGSSDYDQDHRGFWGCSIVPGTRFNSTEIARDLLSQCRDHYCTSGILRPEGEV